MRLITTLPSFLSATAVAAGGLLIALPAGGAQAAPAAGPTCATQADYARVHDGQSVAQVQREMGGVGAGTPTRGHGPGTRDLEKTYEACSAAGLPVKGALQFGIDLQADAGKALRVVGKTELPPTSVPGLTYLLGANG